MAPRRPRDIFKPYDPAEAAAPLSGSYLDTLLFYSLLAGALVVLTDLLPDSLGVSPRVALALKPLSVYVCAFQAARCGWGAAPAAGVAIGVLSGAFYEISLLGAALFLNISLAPGFGRYLILVLGVDLLAGLAAGVLAACLPPVRPRV